jgi:uncharacterized protein (TIGR02217 family)
MSFHDVLFPLRFAFGSTGGPRRKSDVATLASGADHINTTWSDSRRKWDASTAVKSLDDMAQIIAFWEARLAKLHGFRFRDPFDWKSCPPSGAISPLDQAIGTGTGALATFQLKKTYLSGPSSWVRTITKPVSGSVRVAVAGVEKTITTHFTVDLLTGIVTFTGGNIPTMGQAVTAGFHFDVPARFDTDEIDVNLEAFNAGAIPQIPIIEDRRA